MLRSIFHFSSFPSWFWWRSSWPVFLRDVSAEVHASLPEQRLGGLTSKWAAMFDLMISWNDIYGEFLLKAAAAGSQRGLRQSSQSSESRTLQNSRRNCADRRRVVFLTLFRSSFTKQSISVLQRSSQLSRCSALIMASFDFSINLPFAKSASVCATVPCFFYFYTNRVFLLCFLLKETGGTVQITVSSDDAVKLLRSLNKAAGNFTVFYGEKLRNVPEHKSFVNYF